jgi:hypothetical protein
MIRSVSAATVGAEIAISIALAQATPPKIIVLVGPPGRFRADLCKDFILDGYPTTAGQAKALDAKIPDQQLPKSGRSAAWGQTMLADHSPSTRDLLRRAAEPRFGDEGQCSPAGELLECLAVMTRSRAVSRATRM